MMFTPAGVPILPTNIVNVHSIYYCGGEFCVIHNPSPHSLQEAPIYIGAHAYAYRMCDHGVLHPDPDSRTYFKDHPQWIARAIVKTPQSTRWKRAPFVHNKKCDGCCK